MLVNVPSYVVSHEFVICTFEFAICTFALELIGTSAPLQFPIEWAMGRVVHCNIKNHSSMAFGCWIIGVMVLSQIGKVPPLVVKWRITWFNICTLSSSLIFSWSTPTKIYILNFNKINETSDPLTWYKKWKIFYLNIRYT